MTTYRAADLPARSIVADEQRGIVWMAVDAPGTDRWASRGGDEESDSVIDYALQHRGATVVRVGAGQNATMGAVKPGQLWADNDKRSTGRRIRVVEVDATHATVELVAQRGRPARGHEDAQKAEPGRRTRIRLTRFRPTSTGYRLIHDPEEG